MEALIYMLHSYIYTNDPLDLFFNVHSSFLKIFIISILQETLKLDDSWRNPPFLCFCCLHCAYKAFRFRIRLSQLKSPNILFSFGARAGIEPAQPRGPRDFKSLLATLLVTFTQYHFPA